MSDIIAATPSYLAILIGLAGLVWGADRFVDGSAGAARRLGIPPLIIGLTIVSIGTSAPEILVAVESTLRGSGSMAVGNALGSNLCNIGLVLGATALVAPLPSQWHLLKQESPILIFATLLLGGLILDGELSRFDGLLLMALLIPLMWGTIYLKKRSLNKQEVSEEVQGLPDVSITKAALLFAVGLAALLIGADFLVDGAKRIATSYGVSDTVIGLTVLAIGTSLPELAASITSAVRGHHDIALGNIFGSNLFNILAVMSVPGAIATLPLEDGVFSHHYLSMLAITLLLIIVVWWSLRGRQQGRLGRRFGATLLALYGLYTWSLFANGGV